MIELNKTFKKYGNEFQQLLKSESIVLYMATYKRADGGDGHYFEVFKPRVHCPDMFHDDDYELYPAPEEFGRYGWCCSTAKHLLKVVEAHFTVLDVSSVQKVLDGVLSH